MFVQALISTKRGTHDQPRRRAPVNSLLLALLFLSGCFPMPMPDYNAGTRAGKIQLAATHLEPIVGPRDVVFVVEKQNASSSNLGTQFVFGFLPVTRLFIEQGEQSFLSEALVDYLASLNVASFVVPENVLPPESGSCGMQLRPSFVDLSVNAYDLLFFRRMCVSGKVQLAVRRKSADKIFQGTLDDCRLTSFAYSPQLSAFLEKRSFAVLRSLWEQLKAERNGRKRYALCPPLDRPLLVVATPQFPDAEKPESSTSASPNMAALGRAWQRGVQHLASSRDLTVALPFVPQQSLGSSLRQLVEWHLPGAWIVESEVLSAQRVEEELQIRVGVRLIETRNDRSISLQHAQCDVVVRSQTSGIEPVNQEMAEAGAQVFEKFFDHKCEES